MERSAGEKLVERWLSEVLAERKLAVFDDLLSEDALDLGSGTRGREPFKARARAVHAAFAEIETSLDELVIEGQSLAWRWSLTGMQVGAFAGVSAGGRRVTLRGVNFQLVAHGRVSQHWTLADTFGLLQALRES